MLKSDEESGSTVVEGAEVIENSLIVGARICSRDANGRREGEVHHGKITSPRDLRRSCRANAAAIDGPHKGRATRSEGQLESALLQDLLAQDKIELISEMRGADVIRRL